MIRGVLRLHSPCMDTCDRTACDVRAWLDAGFDETSAAAWIDVEPAGRFTPVTAREWTDEGFGPADAALWSEVFADPKQARRRRNAGYLDPFTLPICG
jgi:hypothetical protein